MHGLGNSVVSLIYSVERETRGPMHVKDLKDWGAGEGEGGGGGGGERERERERVRGGGRVRGLERDFALRESGFAARRQLNHGFHQPPPIPLIESFIKEQCPTTGHANVAQRRLGAS